jgi:dolichol kinase
MTITKLEVRRKSIHMGSLVIPIGYAFVSKTEAMVPLLAVTSFFVFFDIIRHHNRAIRRIYEKHLIGSVIRQRERSRLVGSTYFMMGACLCVWLLDKPIAIVSLLVLIISDTIAALVGTTVGRVVLFGSKTLEGSAAFLLSALLIVFVYPGVPFLWGVAGAIVATLVELLPLRVDDNLLIPLAMGFTIQGLAVL